MYVRIKCLVMIHGFVTTCIRKFSSPKVAAESSVSNQTPRRQHELCLLHVKLCKFATCLYRWLPIMKFGVLDPLLYPFQLLGVTLRSRQLPIAERGCNSKSEGEDGWDIVCSQQSTCLIVEGCEDWGTNILREIIWPRNNMYINKKDQYSKQ